MKTIYTIKYAISYFVYCKEIKAKMWKKIRNINSNETYSILKMSLFYSQCGYKVGNEIVFSPTLFCQNNAIYWQKRTQS